MTPKPLGSFVRWFMVICVCGAIGATANVILFFLAAFLFAGAEGDSWVRWYFGNNGVYFVAVTVLLGSLAFPFVKQLRYRLV